MSANHTTREGITNANQTVMDDLLNKLRQLIPAAFTGDDLDWDELRILLGDAVNDQPERYRFTWSGKSAAIQALRTPTWSTLSPAPDQSVDFDTTQNLFIEGDNLEVLKLLYKSYFGRIKMIYIDPPYNTGNDFIYPDNFAQPKDTYLKLTGQIDGNGNHLTTNSEASGRYHSAWLSMMYPRLFLARQLLRDDGVIFISIDDHEVANLRILMNEIFGEENFIATVIWQKVYAPKNSAKYFSEDHDYILVYGRSKEGTSDAPAWTRHLLPRSDAANAHYGNPDNDPRGLWRADGVSARNYYSKGQYEAVGPTGRRFAAPKGRYWTVSKERFEQLDRDHRIWWGTDGNNAPALKRFLSEVQQGIVPQTLWTYEEVGHTQDAKKELLDLVAFEHTENVLDTVKPVRLIQRMLQIATDPQSADTFLDFFAGSSSSAHAVLKQNHEDNGNRRFISVQFPQPLPTAEPLLHTIADIGKQRLHHVIANLQAETAAQLDLGSRDTPEDLGFRVFTLVPSAIRAWQAPANGNGHPVAPAAYAEQLALYNDPLPSGFSPAAVLWEVAIREGFSLSSHVAHLDAVPNNTVYRVDDADREQVLLLCLDDRLDPSTPAALALTPTTLFVCRDVALTDDLAANLSLQCRLKTI